MSKGLYSFGKKEKLCKVPLIEEIFDGNQGITEYPIRLLYLKTDLRQDVPCQVGITVPKKKHKRAVVRNLLKRRIREAYRLNKMELVQKLEDKNEQYALFFIYLSKDISEYKEIEEKIILILNRLVSDIVKE